MGLSRSETQAGIKRHTLSTQFYPGLEKAAEDNAAGVKSQDVGLAQPHTSPDSRMRVLTTLGTVYILSNDNFILRRTEDNATSPDACQA